MRIDRILRDSEYVATSKQDEYILKCKCGQLLRIGKNSGTVLCPCGRCYSAYLAIVEQATQYYDQIVMVPGE
ncbi:MAG: hypothetical protein DRH70_09890 [Candidatus Coatesbacteria bacterium]|nr:MAG: hypothetical protein DRH70_09890 [Candidatus Coatesbacteria bacterium]